MRSRPFGCHPSHSATALAPGAFRHPTRSLWPAAIDVYVMHGYVFQEGTLISIYLLHHFALSFGPSSTDKPLSNYCVGVVIERCGLNRYRLACLLGLTACLNLKT